MSLILDALRKSEEQRRLGQPPSLGDQLPPYMRSKPRARTMRKTYALLALPAIAAAIFAFWWLGPGSTPRTGRTQAVAPLQDQAASGAPSADAASQPPAVAQTAPSAHLPPVRQPRVIAVPPPLPPASQAQISDQKPMKPLDAPAVMPEAQPVAAAPPAAVEPSPVTEAPPTAPAANPMPSASLMTDTGADLVPSFFELPLAVRQSMPGLKVTMRVYDADPSRRFAIINDVRLAEGASLDNGLKLVEIRPDEMVFEHVGQRFRWSSLGP